MGRWRNSFRGRRVMVTLAAGSVAAIAATMFGASAAAAPGGARPGSGHLTGPAAVPAAAAETVTVTSHFLWRPVPDSLSGDSTFIDNGATNGHQKALLFVTPNLTPGGISPCPCLVSAIPPIGIWYENGQWAIFNEDSSDMGTLFAYNVLVVPKAGASAFTVQAKAGTVHGDYVIINSPATNNNPDAALQVTQNYQPSAVFNAHPIGVKYFKVRRRWAIFNEDGHAMPHGAAFNVLVGGAASNGGKTQVFKATAANHLEAAFVISNKATTGNPNGVVFATPDYNPGDKGGTTDAGNLVTGYSGTKAFLINWGGPAIPVGASFNLLVFPS